MCSSHRRCPFCKGKLWPHNTSVGRWKQKQARRSCTSFRCALCQNVDAPVPRQIWQSSREGERRWLNSAWPIPAWWREKSTSWNSLDGNLVPFEKLCCCTNRSCRDGRVKFSSEEHKLHGRSGPFWLCNRLVYESCIHLVPFLAKRWPPHLALQIWG